jgi:cytidine deaminase
MDQDEKSRLVGAALAAAACAYAPYSNFHVGAVVVDDAGECFTGCNVENASFGLTNCAERTALFKKVSEGNMRPVTAIAIASPDAEGFLAPCGACRQVIMELAPQAFVLLGDRDGNFIEKTAAELLPGAFQLPG